MNCPTLHYKCTYLYTTDTQYFVITAKPWMKHVKRGDSRYDYWDQYNKPECNGHGSCSNVTRKCICTHDYIGTFCDEKTET